MKINNFYFGGFFAFLALCSFLHFNPFGVSSMKTESLIAENVKALADTKPDNEGTGGENPHGGGLANKHCPIWNVNYEYNLGFEVKVGCSTGGDYKCEAGACPHGF